MLRRVAAKSRVARRLLGEWNHPGVNGDMTDQRSGGNGVQGEGDYRSAREYKRDIDRFMREKSGQIHGMAKKAEKAIEGAEGKDLKRAEEKGKSKARH
jgi:hypothetical protein